MLRPLLLALLVTAAPTTAARAQDWPAEWSAPAEPFTLFGNLHYVGTEGISAWLITTPRGHFLIDGAMPDSGKLIARNVEKLGFKLKDVRYLLNSHAHIDHAGGLAELKQLTGAKMVSSLADKPALEAGGVDYGATAGVAFPAIEVDQVIADGAKLSLGGTTLTALITPGHTKGCTTWITRVRDRGVERSVIIHCGTTLGGQDLHGDAHYKDAAKDFRRSHDRLKSVKADVFLVGHAELFDLWGKKKRLDAGDRRAFIDPAEFQRHLASTRASFERALANPRPRK